MSDTYHKDLVDANLHKPGYVQSDDPGAVGAGILWIDTSESVWIAKIRNAADDGWETIGLGVVGLGTADQVLTSNGAGAAPTFQDAPAGGDTTHMAQDMQELTDGANISWDMDSGGFAYVTLGGNRTLDNPSNVSAGGLYRLKVTQDGTGSRTLSYGANFKFPGGTDPVLSSGAGDVDMLEFIAYDSSTLYLVNFVADLQ
jgi:hypothetical protein